MRQNPREGRKVYSALRAYRGVVCAQINTATGNIVTRGPATLQDIVLVLKGMGFDARATESSKEAAMLLGASTTEPTCDGVCPTAAASSKNNKRSSQVAYPDLGYIADMKSVYTVKGMTCGACVASIERALGKVDGVKSVSVALLTETTEILYDGKRTSWQSLLKAIADVGYNAAHMYTTSMSSVEYSRRLFAVDMVRGSVNNSAFNCISVITHTMGLIALNWVSDGSSGLDNYEGGPVSASNSLNILDEEGPRSVNGSSFDSLRYGSLTRRHSFTGMAPDLYHTIPSDIAKSADHFPTVDLSSFDPSQVSSTEVVLQAVFDSQIVGLRTIYEAMCSLNPHFVVRLLPEKVCHASCIYVTSLFTVWCAIVSGARDD